MSPEQSNGCLMFIQAVKDLTLSSFLVLDFFFFFVVRIFNLNHLPATNIEKNGPKLVFYLYTETVAYNKDRSNFLVWWLSFK